MNVLGPALFLVLAVAAAKPHALPTDSPDCLQYYHQACSEAIGAWLPRLPDSFEPFQTGKTIGFTDAFVYEGRIPKLERRIGAGGGPPDGTFFVYGSAGPPKGGVVYDYRHHIAFYSQGCCAWRSAVAAEDVAPPPKKVVARDLNSLRTVRGIALGDPSAKVLRIYGPARFQTIAGLRVLAYVHNFDKSCGQSQAFGFHSDHLVYIELMDAC